MNEQKPTLSQYCEAWAIDTGTAPVRIFSEIYKDARQDSGPIISAMHAGVGGVTNNIACGIFGFGLTMIPAAIVIGAAGLDPASAKVLVAAFTGAVGSQGAFAISYKSSRTIELCEKEQKLREEERNRTRAKAVSLPLSL